MNLKCKIIRWFQCIFFGKYGKENHKESAMNFIAWMIGCFAFLDVKLFSYHNGYLCHFISRNSLFIKICEVYPVILILGPLI